MFVKQIDIKTALELAAKGKEVLVMEAGQIEPAGQTIEFGPAEPENAQHDPSHQPEENEEDNWRWKEKLIALHNAGWSVVKIADELGISTRTVYNYLPSKD